MGLGELVIEEPEPVFSFKTKKGHNIKIIDLIAQASGSNLEFKEILFCSFEGDKSWLKNPTNIFGHNVNIMRDSGKLLFVTHSEDTICGKPVAISKAKTTYPVVEHYKTEQDESVYKFLGQKGKKTSNYYLDDSLFMDFYLYKIHSSFDDKEYIVFSKDKLNSEEYIIEGMSFPITDNVEISNTLKIKSNSNGFFVKEARKSIETLDKKELVELVKELDWSQESFKDLVFTRKIDDKHRVFDLSDDTNLFIISWLLSGRRDNYPLHIMLMGITGTGKTYGLYSLQEKFKESGSIFNSENSTLKGMIPSFKSMIPEPGYIMNCNRVALIDELFKMLNNAKLQTSQKENFKSYFSCLNSILEHSEGTYGSGNRSFKGRATSKCIFATNPLTEHGYIEEHFQEVDVTTLARMIIFVQDGDDIEFMRKKKMEGEPRINTHEYLSNDMFVTDKWNKIRNNFLTIFDSCQVFNSDIDIKRVGKLHENLSVLSGLSSGMTTYFDSRGVRNMYLMLDGIVKYRCLFKDKTEDFTAIDEDYEVLEKLMNKIIKSWSWNFKSKQWMQ